MSRVRALKKAIRRKNDILNSFMGSVIQTAAILTQATEDEAAKYAKELKKTLAGREDITVRKVFKTAFEHFKKADDVTAVSLIPSAVLFIDNNELLSPRVTLYYEHKALPLNKEGIELGIIGEFNKDKPNDRFDISAEPLFDSLEDYNKEELLS